MNNTKTCIDNLINGNLTDAKAQARGLTLKKIYTVLRRDYSYFHRSAYQAAYYLKYPSETSFQAYCDSISTDKDNP